MDANELSLSNEVQNTDIKGTKERRRKHSDKPKAVWNARSNEIFINLCVTEKRAGNRPKGCFNKLGWSNILKRFAQKTGKKYDRLQLKNHYDTVRKDWQLWDLLVRDEPKLGWDHEKQTVSASDEWWEEKVMKEPKLARFRDKGLEHCFLLDELFLDEARTWVADSGVMPTVYSQPKSSEGDDTSTNLQEENSKVCGLEKIAEAENVVDRKTKRSNEDNDNTQQEGKKGKITSRFLKQLDRIIEVAESKNERASYMTTRTSPSGHSIEDVMGMLDEIPEITQCDELYMLGTRLFMKADNREMFKALRNPKARYAWLRQEQCRESGRNV